MFRKIPLEAFGTKSIVRIRDIESVIHNYRLFKSKADLTGSICGVVLKADVHGLGMIDVAPALYADGARHFFIEEISEGISLRNNLANDDANVYAMAGLLEGEEEYLKDYHITPCVNCLEQLDRWNKYCGVTGRGKVIIHLDTHMNRLGLLDDEVAVLSRQFDEFTSHLDVEFYMSHFFDIKGDDHTNCYLQLDILNSYLKLLPPRPVTFACTDSVILLNNEVFNFDMIRPGIGIVGGAPNAGHPVSPDAKHTIEIYAKVSQIKTVKQGKTIGYGGAYTTRRDTRMALVHIGYKDGYLRSLSETDADPKGAFMFIQDHLVPIMGKISLGATVIDVTDVPMQILDEFKYAEVIGPNVDLKVLADKAGCYEILAALGRSNPKIADYTLKEFNTLFPS